MAETPFKHTPEPPKPKWAFTLKEGGYLYEVNMPATEELIERMELEVLHPGNWGRYLRNPYGGDRNYTRTTIFPPFTPTLCAEIIFPDGRRWNSRQRKFIAPEEQK